MEVAEGICQNISIGGMLVHTDNPRPQGSLVRFDLEIENNIRGLGEVVWMRAKGAGPGQESGMGIKFRFLEQRDRQLIFKLVSEHIKQRLSQKHPGTETPVPQLATLAPATPPDDLTTPEWKLDDGPTLALSPPAAPQPAAPQPAAPEPAAAEPPSAAEPLTTAGGDLLTPLDEMSDDVAGSGAVGSGAGTAVEAESFSLTPLVSDVDSPLGSPTDVDLPLGSPLDTDDDLSSFGFDSSDSEDREEEGSYEPRADSEEPYRPRVKRRRDLPVLPAVLILALVGAALLYFNWGRLFGPPAPPVTAVEDAPAGGPPTGGEAQPPADPAEPPLGETPPPPAETELTPVPPPAAAPAPPPAPAPAPPPPPAATAREFTRVTNISWTRRPGGVKIEIEADGAIRQGRFSYFRIEGEKPREVIRLKGVVQKYSQSVIPLTGSPVSRIRVGYHANKELHLVLDILDSSTKISSVRSRGNKLEIYLE